MAYKSNFDKRREWATAEQILAAMKADHAALVEESQWEYESERAAELAVERWFEERGGPTAEDYAEDARERWLESLAA